VDIKFSLRQAARFFGIVGGGLLVLNLAACYLRYVVGLNSIVLKWFLFGEEQNVPTYYSSTLFLVCAILALVVAVYRARARETYVAHWVVLAAIFVYCALDEMIEIHERLVKPFRALFHTQGLLYWAWIIPFGALLAVFVLSYLGFLKHLPGRTRTLLVSAGAIYVLGAMGIEMLGGLYYFGHPGRSFVYALYQTVEESLEISGLSLSVYALCAYIKDCIGYVTIGVGPP
jgi:hypothetical protein